jgi:hypothetical protein
MPTKLSSLWNFLFNRKTFEKPAPILNKENIRAFFQGHLRSLKAEYGHMDKHILEQAAWRMTKAKKECVKKDQCQACGCFPMHDKVLEDRPCEGGCYPAMMDKEYWETFKRINEIKC